jgi:hypothetical protein
MKLMRVALAVLITTLGVGSAFAVNKGIATFKSGSNDFIGQGKTWSIAPTDGIWSAAAQGRTSVVNGKEVTALVPYYVEAHYVAKPSAEVKTGTIWRWAFTLGGGKTFSTGLTTGEDDGPGPSSDDILVDGSGRGCSGFVQFGKFTVSKMSWDLCPFIPPGETEPSSYSFVVRRLVARFEAQCGDPPRITNDLLTGTIDYTGDGKEGCSPDGSIPGGGGDTGGGDTGGSGETAAFQLAFPTDFATEPFTVANGTLTDIPLSTQNDGSFQSEVTLFATTDAQDFEDFRVELTPSTIPSPGIGTTTLRIITGPNTFPRTYQVTVTGLSGDHGSSTTLLVNVTCDPPTILGIDQPKSINAANGSQVTLQVKPTGSGPFFYQWYKGVPGMTRNPVLAANESKLIFTTRETATYWVRVSNACGTADSNGATVTTTGSLAGPARRRGGKS